ncbi:signal peptidase II [Paenibacillus sp. N1-5-1-14]|uniref:signal peptidase II n=1 Tax=Paenibacillus radicibacter TaxID=2972488 RepID=UPI002158F3C0|nr:signal peptidase II [Paenibacillus radicibacter]MCR8641897.1 signal peptidase II [Paenibacillus radicibacter]
MRYYIYALIVVIVDQITKWLIRSQMDVGQSISVIGEFFQLTSHRNRGAAFGILMGQRWFFIVITTAVVIGIVIMIRKTMKESGRGLFSWALCLILGGAIGNFIDRLVSGEVTDFFHFNFVFDFFGKHVDYDFAIFNVADCAIVIGVGLALLDTLIVWRQESRGKANE